MAVIARSLVGRHEVELAEDLARRAALPEGDRGAYPVTKFYLRPATLQEAALYRDGVLSGRPHQAAFDLVRKLLTGWSEFRDESKLLAKWSDQPGADNVERLRSRWVLELAESAYQNTEPDDEDFG